MSLFFESIKIENGRLPLLELHQERMNETRRVFFENVSPILLKNEITIPKEYQKGIVKLRILYDAHIQKIELMPYEITEHRSVKLIEMPTASYTFKSQERTLFQDAMKINAGFDDCIFIKNGLLSDATYSNLIFFDGKKWVTPKDCLLKGIKRRFLLENNQIIEAQVSIENILSFSKIGFINALRDFEKVYYFQQKDDILVLTKAFD